MKLFEEKNNLMSPKECVHLNFFPKSIKFYLKKISTGFGSLNY